MPTTDERHDSPGAGRCAPHLHALCMNPAENCCATRVLDVLGSGVLLHDPEGQVVFLNPAGKEILGITGELGKETRIEDIFAPLSDLLVAGAEPDGPSDAFEIDVVRQDGRQIRIGFRTAVSAAASPGDVDLSVLLFREIDDYVRLRRERNHLLRVATIGRLLPTIAHEIKNPLAGIRALTEVLEKEVTGANQREDLRAILTETERLQMVVDGLSLAGQTLRDPAGRVLPADEIGAVLRMLDLRARQQGVKLSFTCNAETRLPLDGSMLKMTLLNLMNNAFEACVRGDTVSLGVSWHDDLLELVVTDTGCGMAAETLGRATELFFSTKQRGSGIGLALVDEIVRRSGGTMQLTSQKEEGTTVRLLLPVEGCP